MKIQIKKEAGRHIRITGNERDYNCFKVGSVCRILYQDVEGMYKAISIDSGRTQYLYPENFVYLEPKKISLKNDFLPLI